MHVSWMPTARGTRLGVGVVAVLFGLSACSDGGTTPAPTSSPAPSAATDSGAPDAPPAPVAYPAGPYGSDVGATIRDFRFDALSPPSYDPGAAAPVTLLDFYSPKGEKGRKILVINLCSVWCAPCKDAFGSLAAKASEYAPKGVAVLGVLFENGGVKPISLAEASEYAKAHGTTVPVAIDPTYQMGGFLRPAEVPGYVVVSARDMKVLGSIKSPDQVWPFVDQKLSEIR